MQDNIDEYVETAMLIYIIMKAMWKYRACVICQKQVYLSVIFLPLNCILTQSLVKLRLLQFPYMEEAYCYAEKSGCFSICSRPLRFSLTTCMKPHGSRCVFFLMRGVFAEVEPCAWVWESVYACTVCRSVRSLAILINPAVLHGITRLVLSCG